MRLKWLIFTFLFPQFVWATVSIFDAKSNQRLAPTSYKLTEGWNRREDGGLTVYGAGIELADKALSQKATSVVGGEIITRKEGKFIVVGAPKALVKDEAGQDLLRVEWVPERKGIFYTKCQTKIFSFRLDRKNEQLDYPIAINCELEANPPRFTISVPDDVDWVDYSFSEVEGKGDRTRMFELPSGNLTTDTVGEFTFARAGKAVKFPINVKKLGEDEGSTEGLAFEKSLAIGTSTLNYTATESFSAQSFMLKFKGMSGYFFNALRFNMQLKNTFNMSDDPKAITLTDLGLGVGYFKAFGSFEVGITGQYRYLGYSHAATQANMQSSQLGVLLSGVYKTGSHKINAEVSMANFGSKVVQSHMDIIAGYAYLVKMFGTQTWIGGEYEMQTVTASDEAGNSRQFDDMNMLLSFSF